MIKAKKTALFISQKENFAGNHGYVVRSSAIFYYNYSNNFTTTISFMNYWRVKRDLDVMIIASTRNMRGELKLREVLNFNEGNVINYKPDISLLKKDNGKNVSKSESIQFEGSVEIEIFSNTNMVIPYAAIMAIYQMPKSISMVHSYGRTYCPHEVEENRTISIGHESCWTIRDSCNIKSFCVFHNGYSPCEEQDIVATLSNCKGEKLTTTILFPSLAPFQSCKFYPADYFPEIINFLHGEPGNASISYKLSNAFTRLLVGNETENEIQVTHSNFNYAIHNTDCVDNGEYAYMKIVNMDINNSNVVVYPDCHLGQYTMFIDNQTYPFDGNKRLEIPIEKNTLIKFSREDGALPMRIVTAYSGKKTDDIALPFECSLGVHHHNYPARYSHWGIVTGSKGHRSLVICQLQTQLFGEIDNDQTLNVTLYSTNTHKTLTHQLTYNDIQQLQHGQYLDQLFPGCGDFLNAELGYIYLNSSYPGFSFFTTLESDTGSMTFEHTF